MNSELFICSFFCLLHQPKHSDMVGTTGNVLLDRTVGAKIVVTPNVAYETKSAKSLKDMLFEYAEKLR